MCLCKTNTEKNTKIIEIKENKKKIRIFKKKGGRVKKLVPLFFFAA